MNHFLHNNTIPAPCRTFTRVLASLILLMLLFVLPASSQVWKGPYAIPVSQEAKPYTRWWWLGSAVDEAGLEYNLTEYAKAGIGGVEITPIYGVQGNDANEIPYLSPRWMQMLKYVKEAGDRLGIETNMATGTGWPFGGPLVSRDDAASKAVFKTDSQGKVTIEVGKTGQMVKRAAPGGEGYVIDHFDRGAVARYLSRFDSAFKDSVNASGSLVAGFFNDSYEVYGADWTPTLYDEFKVRREYDLAPFAYVLQKPDAERTEQDKRILSDYRETMGELLLENFTTQWTEWAHAHGAITRNQAHGSPANLLDLYAEVDIPECEGFGLSNFHIKGLRLDTAYTKKNFSDISMLKYASSGAHLSGAKFTSSETFTWLTEHFRTSLSQCKPDLDLFFVSGINHVFFHGSCYSPKDEEWPGWRFYASVDMTPANNWWDAMPAFSEYIQRCQSFLQWGSPDNDVLVYLPFYDMIFDQPGTIAMFDIHSMEKRAPKFIETVQSIIKAGYDVDYISDRYLQKDDVVSRYSAIIVPDVKFMPLQTLQKLERLAASGKRVVFVKSYPESVPGNGRHSEMPEFHSVLSRIKSSTVLVERYGDGLEGCGARPEPMRSLGVSCVRRSNDDGFHYFISNLQENDVDEYVSLGINCNNALFYNPMNGQISHPSFRADGCIRLQLKSGESVILRTFNADREFADVKEHSYYTESQSIPLYDWTLTFTKALPEQIAGSWTMREPKSWTLLGDSLLNFTMATGRYSTSFNAKSSLLKSVLKNSRRMVLNLGDVRETARVIVNDQEIASLFAVPYEVDITDFIHKGNNTISVEVANLPANRIAQLDRQSVEWRKFKEINVVDLNYKRTKYGDWEPTPSGLCSAVTIEIR